MQFGISETQFRINEIYILFLFFLFSYFSTISKNILFFLTIVLSVTNNINAYTKYTVHIYTRWRTKMFSIFQ